MLMKGLIKLLLKDLFKKYSKKDLIGMINICIPAKGLNKYKKEELLNAYCKFFLSEEHLTQFLFIFTPNVLKFINEAINKKLYINKTNINAFYALAEKYIACVCDDKVMIPSDFAENFKKIYTSKFKEKHKIVNYVFASKVFCDNFYGIYTRDEYLNVVNLYSLAKNSPLTKDIINQIFEYETEETNHSDIPTDILKSQQANKATFIPTYDMVIEYMEKGYISTIELKKLDEYLEDRGIDFSEIVMVNKFLQIKGTDNVSNIAKELTEEFEFRDIDEVNEFFTFLMPALNSMHTIYNRGYAPSTLALNDINSDIVQ